RLAGLLPRCAAPLTGSPAPPHRRGPPATPSSATPTRTIISCAPIRAMAVSFTSGRTCRPVCSCSTAERQLLRSVAARRPRVAARAGLHRALARPPPPAPSRTPPAARQVRATEPRWRSLHPHSEAPTCLQHEPARVTARILGLVTDAPAPRTPTPTDVLADEYVATLTRLSPMMATEMGLPGAEDTLDDLSPAG